MSAQGDVRVHPRPESVSVVIAVRNGMPYFPDLLASVLTQEIDLPLEVVVADNGSTDGTAEVAAGAGAPVRVVDAARGQGKRGAQRIGVAASTGELVVFIDGDDVCGDGWLAALVDRATAGDIVTGALEVELLNDRRVIDSRPYIDGVDDLPRVGRVPYPVGGNVAIRRQDFDRLDLADVPEVSAEDLDLGCAAARAGMTVVFAPEAVVHYRLRSDGEGLRRQMRNYGRSLPWLRSVYPEFDIGGDDLATVARKWCRVLPRAVKARLEGNELHWARAELSSHIGRVEGSFRYRTRCF